MPPSTASPSTPLAKEIPMHFSDFETEMHVDELPNPYEEMEQGQYMDEEDFLDAFQAVEEDFFEDA